MIFTDAPDIWKGWKTAKENDLTYRQCESARIEHLRFQVGVMEQRPERQPVYAINSYHIIGYEDATTITGRPITVSVFRLLGFGSTIEQAERMAKGRLSGKREMNGKAA